MIINVLHFSNINNNILIANSWVCKRLYSGSVVVVAVAGVECPAGQEGWILVLVLCPGGWSSVLIFRQRIGGKVVRDFFLKFIALVSRRLVGGCGAG
jgi:hypothetical protein